MPQHLKIKCNKTLVAWLSTYNQGGSNYKIHLRVPEIGSEYTIPTLDTGVQRQPQDPQAKKEDFRDDFTHVRRCIAGTYKGSELFLREIYKITDNIFKEVKPINMYLMTNDFDRGLIHIEPTSDNEANVEVSIGKGSNRVTNSTPTDTYVFSYGGIDFSEKTVTVRALAWADDPPSAWNLRCEIRESLINHFREEGLEYPKFRVELQQEGFEQTFGSRSENYAN